jgi:ABC-type uncharacterized transport system substrate-binding protein
MLLFSGCANLAGSTVAPLSLSIAGRRGAPERYTEIAAEFVRLKVDVIVTQGGAVAAAKKVTSIIPIVFTVAADPLGDGLVASLSRPGGNVAGLSVLYTDLAGKRLELLREAVARLGGLAIMANAYGAAKLEMAEVEATARKLGLEVATFQSGAPRISHPPSRRSRAAQTPLRSVAIPSQPPTRF